MPIRGLLYLAELYKNYIRGNELDIYGKQRVQLPKPIYVVNINYGHNKELMERCRPLKEYAIFVDMIRKYLEKGMGIQQAAHKTVEQCLKKGILKDILLKEK